MKKYKVVGYENRSGVSKKSGKPYDMDIIYVIDEDPLTESGSYGNRVESITYNRLVNGPLEAIPLLNDIVTIFYNRTGFVTDIVKAEA